MKKKALVKVTMIFRKSFVKLFLLGLIALTYSCSNCNSKMYFYKYYLMPNQKVILEINDIVVHDKVNKELLNPNPLNPDKYCANFCTKNLENKMIKIRFEVDKQDTLFFVDSNKIGGLYLGYDYDYKKLTVIVDSIGKGLFWGNTDKEVWFE